MRVGLSCKVDCPNKIFTTASDFSYRSVRLGYLALNNPNILRRLIVRNQSANALQQLGISVAALQWRHFSERFLIELGKGSGKMFQGSAQHTDIIAVEKVGYQYRLCRLVLKIAPEIRASQAPTELLLVRAEEVLCHVVGALDHGDDVTVIIIGCRMAK